MANRLIKNWSFTVELVTFTFLRNSTGFPYNTGLYKPRDFL